MNQLTILKARKMILSVLLCLLPVVMSLFLYRDFLGDDTYIHIGFILGFVSGDGFSFAGNVTYGSTSPLWVVMGAFVTLLTGDPEFSIRLLSGTFSCLSVFLFLLLADILKLKSSIKGVATLSFCLNPFFLRWAVSGMEASAAIAMILFLIYTYNKKVHLRYACLYGLLLGLAFLLRPEFIVFFVMFILYQFFVSGDSKILTVNTFMSGIGLLAAWLTFAYLHFGTVIPNTYRAKAPGGFFAMTLDGTLRNLIIMLGGNVPESVFLAIVIIVTIIIASRKEQAFVEEFVRLIQRFKYTGMFLGGIFFICFYAYYIVKDVTIISRYSLMFLPFVILIVASMINFLALYKAKFNLPLVSGYFVLVLLTHIHITFSIVKPANDAFVSGFQHSFREIADWIKADYSEDYKTVALNDVGIVGCYSGAGIFDLAGLVDSDRFNYAKVKDYIEAKRPDYLVLREDVALSDAIPVNIGNDILYRKEIPGFGINSPEARVVTLYRLYWD